MRAKSYIPLITGLLCMLTALACRPKIMVPEHTADGWQTGSLEDAGIEAQPPARLVWRIENDKIPNIHSILIVKGGKLVFEEYFEGHRFAYDQEQLKGELIRFGIDTTHNTMSVTKAVTAAVVGVAIDQGLMQNEQLAIATVFPEYSHLFNEQKKKITVEHLLTMSSGLQWNEWDVPLVSRENDLIQLFIVSDPVEYILEKPLVHTPGSYWYYSGGDVNLLGVVFEHATGFRIDSFSANHLFRPLGISVFEWNYLKPNIVYASGELYLRPRDLAKLGYLYLNDGVWNGTQVISKEWVEKSLQPHVSTRGRSKEGAFYGYQWWITTFNYEEGSIPAYVRTGWGGQAIIIFPLIDMLLVFTGGNYSGTDPVLDLVQQYILPAIKT
jgi:CubicO group peptidase (beta-lactamase class C family)